jgi:hypothetical protein
MLTPDRAPLLQFLQVELGIPESALTFALKRHGCEQGPPADDPLALRADFLGATGADF